MSCREACPYKGLAQFEADDAAYFFGRERLVGEMVARIAGPAFLARRRVRERQVVVVGAGLFPSLEAGVLPGSEGWPQVSLRPGEHPRAELRAALGPSSFGDAPDRSSRPGELTDGRAISSSCDQAEELFTVCDDDAERQRSSTRSPVRGRPRTERHGPAASAPTSTGGARPIRRSPSSPRTTSWSGR